MPTATHLDRQATQRRGRSALDHSILGILQTEALDARDLSHRTGQSVSACLRALSELLNQGLVRPANPQDKANHLNRVFTAHKPADAGVADEGSASAQPVHETPAATPRPPTTLPNDVYEHLRASPTPLDAYALSQRTGASVMECGRVLAELEQRGAVVSRDPSGTANDLARAFMLDPTGNDAILARHRARSTMWPKGRPETHAERQLREALDHLDKVLNGCRSAPEQEAADKAAREFLAGCGR